MNETSFFVYHRRLVLALPASPTLPPLSFSRSSQCFMNEKPDGLVVAVVLRPGAGNHYTHPRPEAIPPLSFVPQALSYTVYLQSRFHLPIEQANQSQATATVRTSPKDTLQQQSAASCLSLPQDQPAAFLIFFFSKLSLYSHSSFQLL